MPIPIKHEPVKFCCSDCGWSVVRLEFVTGDCISPLGRHKMQPVTTCPVCQSEKITETEPSLFDRINPKNRVAWQNYIKNKHPFLSFPSDNK